MTLDPPAGPVTGSPRAERQLNAVAVIDGTRGAMFSQWATRVGVLCLLFWCLAAQHASEVRRQDILPSRT